LRISTLSSGKCWMTMASGWPKRSADLGVVCAVFWPALRGWWQYPASQEDQADL
jgi:hypothetical protein